jgi:hypothetical protein
MMWSGTPALPSQDFFQWAMPFSWAVVFAWCGMALWQRSGRRGRTGLRVLAGLLAVSAFLPGVLSTAYWLALAFQFPSVLTVLLCGLGLVRGLRPASGAAAAHLSAPWCMRLAGAGVLAGWVLFLDVFGLLPVPVFEWGFGPVMLYLLLALALALWVLAGRLSGLAGPIPGLLVLCLLIFAFTRIPEGNVWAALLDPFLWIALHRIFLRELGARAPG